MVAVEDRMERQVWFWQHQAEGGRQSIEVDGLRLLPIHSDLRTHPALAVDDHWSEEGYDLSS